MSGNLPALSRPENFDLDEATGHKQLVGYVSLMHGISKAVNEGTANVGEFLLNGSINLGRSFEATVIDAAPKARFSSEDESANLYDLSDPEFVRIKTQAQNWVPNYHYGLEFLLYIPEHDAYATLHFSRGNAKEGKTVFKAGEDRRLITIRSHAKPRKGQANSYTQVIKVDVGGDAVEPPDAKTLGEAVSTYRESQKPAPKSPIDR